MLHSIITDCRYCRDSLTNSTYAADVLTIRKVDPVLNTSRKYTYENVFIIIMITLIAMFFIGFLRDFSGDQANIFFRRTDDYMADYHNTAYGSADRNPYRYGETADPDPDRNYPPLAYLIFFFLSKCADYFNLDPFTAGWGTTMGIAASSFFMFYISATFYIILYDAYDGKKTYKFLLSTLLLLSSIFIFSFERGNIIILSASCLSFFIVNYNNENKYIRETAYILLAVSAALKVYPAIFGILLLFEKRYKEAVRLVVYGILFVFLPFLFFKGGFPNMPLWINNLMAHTNEYNYKIFPRFNFRFFASRIIDNNIKNFVYTIFSGLGLLVCGLATITSCFHKVFWKTILQLLLVIIILPVNSGEYCALYLFIAMILFFNERSKTKFDGIYLLLFILILNPYQIIYRGIQEWNMTVVLMNLSASIMLILLTLESSVAMLSLQNEHKAHKQIGEI